MFKTVFVIVLSVTAFGVLFFFYVKKILKRQLDFYLSNNKKKIKVAYIFLKNHLLRFLKFFLIIRK